MKINLKKWIILLGVVICLLFTSCGMLSCVKAQGSEDYSNLVDFTVEVESGRDIRVLQLTDAQIIDASQKRYYERVLGTIWAHGAEYDYHEKYVEQIITRYQPDLIIVTGDLVYGEFDDFGTSFVRYVEFMDSFQIPWAPVFGNHEKESNMGVDWQCEQLENSQYCLFKQRELTGDGNYTVGLIQGGKLKRVFFMMDSNGSGGASAISMSNGHTTKNYGFGLDQMSWYKTTCESIKKEVSDVKISFAFHIQLQVFADAYKQYGYTFGTTTNNPINIDTHPNRADGDFGYIGRDVKSAWDQDYIVWESLKSLGVDSIFVGHEHCNSASVVYEGVRLQYGQKSSTYDRANYRQGDGSIVGSYSIVGEPVIGGTTIPISEKTGEIVGGEILYYDPDYQIVKPNEKVETLALDMNGTDFNLTVSTADIKNCQVKSVTDFSNVPAGYNGGVYFEKNASSSHFASLGIKFSKDINVNALRSMKLRMYVENYEVTAGKTPRARIYNDKDNSILVDANFTSYGGEFGKWIEFDLLPLIKQAPSIVQNGRLLPFTFVYRFYTSQTPTIYYDALTLEYVGDLYEMPQIEEDIPEEKPSIEMISAPEYEEMAWAVLNNCRYTRYTLADVGVETLAMKGSQKNIYRVEDRNLSVAFNFTPKTFSSFLVSLLTDGYGKNGMGVTFTPTSFTVGGASFTYSFEEGKTYSIEVGLVPYGINEETGLDNSNTGYLFIKINGQDRASGSESVWWYQVEMYTCYQNSEDNVYFSLENIGKNTELTLDSYTQVVYRSIRGRELGKGISGNQIIVTPEKLAYYADGNEYLKILIDGKEVTMEQIQAGVSFLEGTHKVVFYFLQEPTEPEQPNNPDQEENSSSGSSSGDVDVPDLEENTPSVEEDKFVSTDDNASGCMAALSYSAGIECVVLLGSAMLTLRKKREN